MNIQSSKQALRTAIHERIARLSPEDRRRESRSLCKRIGHELPTTPGVICLFYPMPSEADIRPICDQLLNQGWKTYFPRFEGAAFRFRRVQSLSAMIPGRFGLMEPSEDDPVLDIRTTTIALLPGLGFDGHGGRLGRGNGGYDRWLQELRTKNPSALVWGVAFECQIVPLVPLEQHDRTVDLVITPRGIIDPRSHEKGPR